METTVAATLRTPREKPASTTRRWSTQRVRVQAALVIVATVVSTYRARCRRGRRTVTCTRTRTRRLRATRTSAGRYRVVASGLPAGRHVVTIRATDLAGNRQIVAARRALRTPSSR